MSSGNGNQVSGEDSRIYGSGCCLAAKSTSAFWRISANALGSCTSLERAGWHGETTGTRWATHRLRSNSALIIMALPRQISRRTTQSNSFFNMRR